MKPSDVLRKQIDDACQDVSGAPDTILRRAAIVLLGSGRPRAGVYVLAHAVRLVECGSTWNMIARAAFKVGRRNPGELQRVVLYAWLRGAELEPDTPDDGTLELVREHVGEGGAASLDVSPENLLGLLAAGGIRAGHAAAGILALEPALREATVALLDGTALGRRLERFPRYRAERDRIFPE